MPHVWATLLAPAWAANDSRPGQALRLPRNTSYSNQCKNYIELVNIKLPTNPCNKSALGPLVVRIHTRKMEDHAEILTTSNRKSISQRLVSRSVGLQESCCLLDC